MKEYKSYLINTESKLDQMFQLMRDPAVTAIAVDTETTGLSFMDDRIVGICICFDDERAFYVPTFHATTEWNLDINIVLERLERETRGRLIVMHNAKFDYKFFRKEGWQIGCEIFDTMIADYLLESGRKHSLDECSLRELGVLKIKTEELLGEKGGDQITFDKVSVEDACEYGCEDAWCTLQLYKKFNQELREKKLYHLFRAIEMPLMQVLAHMEMDGVFVDSRTLMNLALQTDNDLKRLVAKISKSIPDQKLKRSFKPTSNVDLSTLLYAYLNLPVYGKTESGKPSTSKGTLKLLVDKHPELDVVIGDILKFKNLRKMRTFLEKLPKQSNRESGRAHGNLNQVIVRTGRLSSSGPNLQNIPAAKRDDNDQLVDCLETSLRRAFRPQREGYSMIAADYSQVELRILAAMSQDPEMLSAFNDDIDIHVKTAALVNGVDVDSVTSTQRKQAKQINFGISYGMGARTLAKRIDVTEGEARVFIDNFYKEYSRVRLFHRNNILNAQLHGYVTTMYERRRSTPGINLSNNRLRSYNERIAKNTPVQGSAADIMKIAMIKIFRKIKDKPEEIKMVLQVHDELVFEVRNDVAEYYKQVIIESMEQAFPEPYSDRVKLVVEAEVAPDWAAAH